MTLPSAVLDLSRWKITLPTGKSGSPTELVGSALQAADIPNTFWVGTDGAVHFRAAVTGVTTSGSGYPRSELRELNADGSLASWSSTDGKTHTMVVDEAVVRIPNPRTSGNAATVCAQIHDKDNDISVFRVEAGKVWVTQGDTTHFALADGNYVPGTRFKAMYTVANGTVTAFYNGTKVVSFPFKGSGLYFKAGAYVQANASNSKPADASNYGETAVWSVQVAHGAPVDQPPAPVPAPVPTPSAGIKIQIIRHGEKPSDPNDHTLSAKGRQRAHALPPLFTTPRADLYRPTWIFASKGTTSSMRMLQTAQPTADALKLTVDTRYDSENAVTQTAQLLADQARAGKVVLAVLEHSCIAAVTSALVKILGGKWNAKPPSSWDDTDFSSIYKIVGDGAGNWVFAKTDEGVLEGDPGYVKPAPTPVPEVPPVTGSQTLGVGGVGTPPGAIVATSDSTAPLTITKPGVYDGKGYRVGRITVKGDNITVQNYRAVGNGQYGIVSEGTNNVIQNNDIKGIKVSGDGDLNALTWFGNGTKLLFNNIENFIEGDPGDSHSDGAQTWVSSSHPVASSDVEIRGNRFVGPANPKRDPKVPSIHQCIMAEDYGRGGNSGGSSSGMKNWVVADNYFGDSWNQCIKLDGVDNVDITRNTFAGSSDKILDIPDGSNVRFWSDNKITGNYKNGVGIPVTPGNGPGAPVPPPPVVAPPPPVVVPPVEPPPVVVEPPPEQPPPTAPAWFAAFIQWLKVLFK